jgi:hypothetical protein
VDYQRARLCLYNHVGRLVLCTCGAQRRWSMAEMEVMRARADGPGAMKSKCWVLTDGPEQPGGQPRWMTPRTRTRARTCRSGPCCWHGRRLTGHVSGHGGRARGAMLTPCVGAKAKTPPFARCLRRSHRTNGG